MPESEKLNPGSFFLVAVQFACIGVLLFCNNPQHYNGLSMFTGLAGIVIGSWAVMVMAAGKLSIFPEVRDGAVLIRRGPYRFIRHPMYLAVILFCGAEVLALFTAFRLAVLILLVIDLVVKMGYEENMLRENFPEYREYQKVTRKLIPFVY